MADLDLRGSLEALLIVADEPASVTQLATLVERPMPEVVAELNELARSYVNDSRGFELRETGAGWRFYSSAAFAPVVERYVLDGQQARLTQASLETLAVVAYKQPVSRGRVSAVRGVNCDGVMRTLAARGLIEEAGVESGSGASLFRTSQYFLERMGLTQHRRPARHRPVPARSRCAGRPVARRAAWPGRCRLTDQADEPPDQRGERLQKVLARAGIASRRVCEELITAGRVQVNGEVASTLGTRVDAENDEIRVDGERVVVSTRKVYVVLNKPRGVVSTMSDPQGRRTLADFLGGFDERLFHVGRLDTDTDGLILLTNDGDLAHRLAHPSFGVSKLYVAQVTGAGRSRRRPAAPGRASSWTTGRPRSSRSGWCRPRATGPWWSSACTRGGTASSGGCSMRWAIRSSR